MPKLKVAEAVHQNLKSEAGTPDWKLVAVAVLFYRESKDSFDLSHVCCWFEFFTREVSSELEILLQQRSCASRQNQSVHLT